MEKIERLKRLMAEIRDLGPDAQAEMITEFFAGRDFGPAIAEARQIGVERGRRQIQEREV